MNNAMESWIERASRGAVRVGALVLLVCLTLTVNSLPTSTFKAATVPSSPHQLHQNHHSPTQSTVVAKSAMSWDDKTTTTAGDDRSEVRHLQGNNQDGVILSTVQTSGEDNNRISTRMRRMSNSRDRNFVFDTAKRMHCRNGYLLAIYDNETINGTTNKNDPHTYFLITTVTFSEVKILGVHSGLYVCMNSHGKLFPSPDATNECVFKEEFLRTLYAVFSSKAYDSGTRRKKSWYIGLGNNGRPRLGRKTKKKHSTTHFLVESV